MESSSSRPSRSDLDELILAQRYRVGHPIGRGGMATVYLGHHLALDRPVAIKVLDWFESQPKRSAMARFLREARLAAKVRHRNIVDIHDFGVTEDGVVYIVMEALVGSDLRAIVKHRTMPIPSWHWAFEVMRQVCAGVEAIHRVGVVHRDLKASNCFVVERSGVVKLLDFGIATQERGSSNEPPNDWADDRRTVVGTPEYMAPEQIRGGAPDRRTDVYAAGILLVELLTGQTPFVGRTVDEVFDRHLHEPPPKLHASCSRALDAVVARALAKSPRKRFQSMAELSAALERIDSRQRSCGPHPLTPELP